MAKGRRDRWKNKMNADEVKHALVQALAVHGIQSRTEQRIRGIYGKFPADVAVLNEKGELVAVAEAKRGKFDLGIKQRTNYATCRVPAFLCYPNNIQAIADAMAAYILRGEQASESILITKYTKAYPTQTARNRKLERLQFRYRFVRG